ncbi:MAG: ATP-binding protein, partial [Chloroflexi bacterium]|nr:ATP-binding protein [Chloroflexota bacterium]
MMSVESLLQQNIILNNRRRLKLRWLAGIMLFVGTFLWSFITDVPAAQLYGLGLFILLYNVLLTYLSGQNPTPSQAQFLVMAQIALDWGCLVLFVWFTGGIASPGLVLFFLHVITVAVLLPGWRPVAYTGLVMVSVLLLTAGEAADVLPHFRVIPGVPNAHAGTFVLAQSVFFGLSLFGIVTLTMIIMQPVRSQQNQLFALFRIVQSVSSTLELTDVLQRLVARAQEALYARGVTLRLLDLTGRSLELVAAQGTGYCPLTSIEVKPGSGYQAALSGSVMLVDSTEIPLSEVDNRGDIMLVPIRNKRALGVITVYFDAPVRVDFQTKQMALAIASQSVAAIENALTDDALQKAEKQRNQFVHIVTHELRSPVSGAQSLLRVLMKYRELSPQQRKILERLSRRMDSLLMLINDLLSLAETKADELQQRLTPVDAKPILLEVLDLHEAEAQEKSLHMNRIVVDVEQAFVVGTPRGVTRIIDNLVGNAIKYTPNGGRITVRLAVDDGNVIISVSDTGIGIPAEAIEKLGQEFFRASNAR